MDKCFLSEIIDKSGIILNQYGKRKHYCGQKKILYISNYDIFSVISGCYTLIINERKYIAQAKDTFLLTPNCTFTIIANDDSVQLFYHFSVIYAGKKLSGNFDDFLLPHSFNFLIGLFKEYTDNCLKDDIFTQTAIKPILKLILIKMIFLNEKNYNCFAKSMSKIYSNQILDVLRYIHMNRGVSIKISCLAKMVGYNENYFSTYFKKNVGISISNYIDNVKMNVAKELLIEKKLLIKEVAMELGFSDQFIFSKKFKKHFGLPPNEFKKIDI